MGGPTDVFKKTSLKKRRGTTRGTPLGKVVSEYQKARDQAFYGSLGGASPVRKIDPSTGKVVAVIDPETGLPNETREDPIKKLKQIGGEPKK
jgi:hypothetical protein